MSIERRALRASEVTLPTGVSATDESIEQYFVDKYGLSPDALDLGVIHTLLDALKSSSSVSEEIESVLVAAVTVGESYFLRHRDHFKWLASSWFPKQIEARARMPGDRTLRVLSAGCSTGEEPYSVVATLGPLIPKEAGWRLMVTAVDIDKSALEAAKLGQYSMWSMRGVVPSEARHWLSVDGRRVAVADWVKQSVSFRAQNLQEPFSTPGLFDVVLCRNVLIYFHPEGIACAWTHLAEAVRPDGILLCGPSDPGPPATVPLRGEWEGTIRVFRPRVAHEAASPAPLRAAIPGSVPARVPASGRGAERTTEKGAPLRASSRVRSSPVTERDLLDVVVKLTRDRHFAVAHQLLSTHLANHPLEVSSHVLMALLTSEMGDPVGALESARRAVFLKPDAAYPAFVMAICLDQLGRTAAADKRYRWAAELLATVEDDARLEYSDDVTARQLREILDGRRAKRI